MLLGNSLLQSAMVHFAFQLTFLLNTLCSSEHFTPQHTLQISTLCSSEYLDPWILGTLLPETLYSIKHFTQLNTLLPRTLYFKLSRVRSMLRRESHQGAINVFQGSLCSKELSVLESWDKNNYCHKLSKLFLFSQNGQVSNIHHFECTQIVTILSIFFYLLTRVVFVLT